MTMREHLDPDTAIYYRVHMAHGVAFNVSQGEGEQLCAKLEAMTTERHVPQFVRVEDLSGSDQVIAVSWIHGVYFSTPEQRAWDKQWNAEAKQGDGWTEEE